MQSCGMARQHFYYLFEDICDAVHWMFGQAAVALLREHEGVTLWQEGLPAAQKAKLQKKLFAGTDEKSPNPWLFTGVYEGGPQARRGQPAEDILFEMQRQGILELARKESCIIWAGAPMLPPAPPASRQSVCSSPRPLRIGSDAGWRSRASGKKRRRMPSGKSMSGGKNTATPIPAGTGVRRRTTIFASTAPRRGLGERQSKSSVSEALGDLFGLIVQSCRRSEVPGRWFQSRHRLPSPLGDGSLCRYFSRAPSAKAWPTFRPRLQ